MAVRIIFPFTPSAHRRLGFNYEDPGCTSSTSDAAELPSWASGFGWVVDHRRVQVSCKQAAREGHACGREIAYSCGRVRACMWSA